MALTRYGASGAAFLIIVGLSCTTIGPAGTCYAGPANFPPVAMMPLAEEKPLTKPQLWGVACNALLDELNNSNHIHLATDRRDAAGMQRNQSTLARWWRVEDKQTLLAAMRWLENGGHRQEFADFGAAVEKNDQAALEALRIKYQVKDENFAEKIRICKLYYKQLEERGLIGWDYCRYVGLCRWGYTAGYLSEQEAWVRLMPAARKLQGTFSSWQELADNYSIGRRFWTLQPAEEVKRVHQTITYLTHEETSPWVKLAWNTDLSGKPAADPKSK